MRAFLCAVENEADSIISLLNARKALESAGIKVYQLERQTILVISGPGKVNAARTTALVIERFHPQEVISFGIGGAFRNADLQPCQIALATEECLADEGVLTGRGFHDLQFLQMPFLKRNDHLFYNRYPVDGRLTALLRERLKNLSYPYKEGSFITVSTVTGTDRRASQLYKRYRVVCENMEGAAIALTCLAHGVAFAEVRAISNIVGKRHKKSWKLREACDVIQDFIVKGLIE